MFASQKCPLSDLSAPPLSNVLQETETPSQYK